MVLSSQNSLFCIIRKSEVEKTPEEIVRQTLLRMMIDERGFLPEYFVVEKKINALPHLFLHKQKLPNRRIDILYYTKQFQPFFLIECKAERFSDKEKRQLLGYNYHIGAQYVALFSSRGLSLFSSIGKPVDQKLFINK